MKRCLFCRSTDTMRPFDRSDRIFILTFILRPLRVRFCRNCGRYFPMWRTRADNAEST
jgi:hypothetical protein